MEYIRSPLRPIQLDLKKLLALVVVTILGGLAFGALYQQMSKHLSPLWIAAAVCHSLLALAIIFMLLKKNQLSKTFTFATSGPMPTKFLYTPSMIVGISVLFALIFSSFLGNSTPSKIDWKTQLAFILWIPVIEELVFRAGVGASLQKFAPGIWGIWFSALIFAWVHTSPTLAGLIGGQMGLPLGPFFLGLICEYLRVAGVSLVPAIIFHMVCNSTVVFFSLVDSRWMDWLSWLYS